jgi:hypothetical protein
MDPASAGNGGSFGVITPRQAGGQAMPQVILKTGLIGIDGQEEVLTEYQCDWTDCANLASQVFGVARELKSCQAYCDEHAALVEARVRNLQRKEREGS